MGTASRSELLAKEEKKKRDKKKKDTSVYI